MYRAEFKLARVSAVQYKYRIILYEANHDCTPNECSPSCEIYVEGGIFEVVFSRVSIRTTFAQFLRNEKQIFLSLRNTSARKQQFAQSFKVQNCTIPLFRNSVLRNFAFSAKKKMIMKNF